jgi:transposase
MRGQKQFTPKLYYEMSLETQVPPDHRLRRLAKVLDFQFIREQTKDLYGHNGHESVDPVVVIKLLLLLYLDGLPSVRATMEHCSDRASYRWFLGYDWDEKIPDHSAISKNLKRFGPELLAELFQRTVAQCVAAGLVGGQLVHADSTLVRARAAKKSLRPRQLPAFDPPRSPEEVWAEVKEEVAVVTADESSSPSGKDRFNDHVVSQTDPDASVIHRPGKETILAYKDHRVVDDRHGIILETLATSAAVADSTPLLPMLARVLERGGSVEAIAADRGYATGENYRGLHQQNIVPYIARHPSPHDVRVFGKEHFVYDASQDVYLCPASQTLPLLHNDLKRHRRVYRAPKATCQNCPLRTQCVTGPSPRSLRRYDDEEETEAAQQYVQTDGYLQALRRRRCVIEGRFGDAKEHHGHRRLRQVGLWAAQVHCYLVAAVQNLKKLLKYGGNKTKNNVFILTNIQTVLAMLVIWVRGTRDLIRPGVCSPKNTTYPTTPHTLTTPF